jgi:hypothetical protein
VPESVRNVARTWMETHYQPFGHLWQTAETGRPAADLALGMPFFDWLSQKPDRVQTFTAAMTDFVKAIGWRLTPGRRHTPKEPPPQSGRRLSSDPDQRPTETSQAADPTAFRYRHTSRHLRRVRRTVRRCQPRQKRSGPASCLGHFGQLHRLVREALT